MSLKAILFDFNGVIINDEAIHRQLIDELLLGENLRPSGNEYNNICLGRCDRFSIREMLEKKGRVISEEYLNKLIDKKARDYQKIITDMDTLPLYEQVIGFIRQMPEKCLLLALVSGALKEEVELILDKAKIKQYFSVIVTGDQLTATKPSPNGYLLAMEKLNQQQPNLQLKPSNCLVIEDTPVGIQSAKNANMQVVGLTHSYPFHVLHRKADWCVDYLAELDLDLVSQVLA